MRTEKGKYDMIRLKIKESLMGIYIGYITTLTHTWNNFYFNHSN